MSCIDKIDEFINEDMPNYDVRALLKGIAICFDELIEQLSVIGNDLENIQTSIDYNTTDKRG